MWTQNKRMGKEGKQLKGFAMKKALTPMTEEMMKDEEKKKPRKKMVSVDIDGTLAHYDGWKGVDKIGSPIPGAREFMEQLHKFARIQIYTARTNTKRNKGHTEEELVGYVKAWLDESGMPYDEVYVGEGKPASSAFVDDRGVSCRPEENRDAYMAALRDAMDLCNVDTDTDQ